MPENGETDPGCFKSLNGRDVTKQAIIDVNSIVSGQNYNILSSIIAKLAY